MKQSKFNVIIPFEGNTNYYIAFNSMSNAMSLITKEQYNQIEKICNREETDDMDEKFISDLKNGGYIVDNNFDEMKYLEFRNCAAKFNQISTGLTIATTLNCNFGCPYCYEVESDNKKSMTEDVQDAIIDYIRNINPRHLNITWYGGEPLLAMNVIERMSNKLLKLVSDNQMSYFADIITNGYLLTEENIKKLVDFKVTRAQITIDGPEEIHNKRRFLKGGQGTYQTVMKNIENACERIFIYLRINVDKTNIDQINSIAYDLKNRGILDKLYPYLGHVSNTNDQYNSDLCFSRAEFAKIDMDFFNLLDKLSEKDTFSYKKRYPWLLYNRCIADTAGGYLIDPEGYQYKCWNHAGMKELAVGNIKNPIKPNQLLFDYALSDDIKNRECKDCKVLPMCLGGCLDEIVRYKKGRCHQTKFVLNDYLNGIASQLVNERDLNGKDALKL